MTTVSGSLAVDDQRLSADHRVVGRITGLPFGAQPPQTKTHIVGRKGHGRRRR